MINNINVCVDCICLPMCINKDENSMVNECAYVKRILKDASLALNNYSETSLYFNGINKKYCVKIENKSILIGIDKITEDDHHERWYLFSYPMVIPEMWVNNVPKG